MITSILYGIIFAIFLLYTMFEIISNSFRLMNIKNIYYKIGIFILIILFIILVNKDYFIK